MFHPDTHHYDWCGWCQKPTTSSREINSYYVSRGDSCHFDFSSLTNFYGTPSSKLTGSQSQHDDIPAEAPAQRSCAITRGDPEITRENRQSLSGRPGFVGGGYPCVIQRRSAYERGGGPARQTETQRYAEGRNSVLAMLALFFLFFCRFSRDPSHSTAPTVWVGRREKQGCIEIRDGMLLSGMGGNPATLDLASSRHFDCATSNLPRRKGTENKEVDNTLRPSLDAKGTITAFRQGKVPADSIARAIPTWRQGRPDKPARDPAQRRRITSPRPTQATTCPSFTSTAPQTDLLGYLLSRLGRH
jgi:hypothetical protein